MRPSIASSDSIIQSLLYNEQKVSLRQAECILAANFLKEADRLTWDDKVLRFERRQQLNERVTTSQHISLNFDPADVLSNKKMEDIARTYMKEIGFEKQPYLVYRHYDAGHPHCHIVSTHIQRNGDPIPQYMLGQNQSEKARILIEKKYDLVTAEKKRLTQKPSRVPDRIQKIKYGEKSTTSAVSNVVHYIMEKYTYSNLEELNAILRLYNVEANPGREGSKLREHHGLLYRVMDDQGHYVGRPLKASIFDFKPTLSRLEEKFKLNQSLKEKLRLHVETPVRWEMTKKKMTREELIKNLARQRIQAVFRKDKHDNILDVAFINFEHKCVFRGEDLHELCRKEAIQKLPTQQQRLAQTQTHRHRHRIYWHLS